MRCLESPSSIQLTAVREENLRAEDSRVKSLVKRILVEDEEPVIGLVAHSILFKRMIQLFWPKDRLRQEELRTALRNGAQKQDTVDPFEDKVMNCGTLVLTFRYHSGGAEIVKAVFLFDGHMESALARDRQTQEPGRESERQIDKALCRYEIQDTLIFSVGMP
ncbi:Uncharacterized protein SCF082_LOCUS37677 [Durusdinium trenchii]|uniref:Uncharacterized protein n=1 Tax=Durusdinium trenchii TaxID=1381693 RepID=A0ABP0PW29_9DINO